MFNSIRRFMLGRYGIDKLGKMLWLFSVVLMPVALFTGSIILSVAAYLFFGICIYRALSKNVVMRLRENRIYMTAVNNIKAFFRRDRKYYRYLHCPKCKKTLKVPKNKGKISITCPHCRYNFIKKT